MFATRVGFYGGEAAKNWWEVTNTEILADIATWNRQGNVSNQSYTSLSGLVSTNLAFWAGVVHPNGNIYYAPYNQSNPRGSKILSFNPSANTVTQIEANISASSGKYETGILAKDNKIYFIPRNATGGVLILDPYNNNSISYQTWGLSGVSTYTASVYAQDENKIYAIGTTHCLILDLTANTAVQSNLGGLVTGSVANRHLNGVYSLKTKRVIFAPYTAYGTGGFLIIDPQNDSAQRQTFGLSWPTQATNNIRNAGDGNIYITSENAVGTFRLNETANTVVSFTGPVMGAPNGGGNLNDGNIILDSPAVSTQTGSILDVYAGTWASNTSVLAPNAGKSTWLMHPDGYSYSLSTTSATPVIFRTNANGTGKNSTIYSSICLSSYFNRAR